MIRVKIQKDVDKLIDWAESNKIKLKRDKYSKFFLKIFKKKKKKEYAEKGNQDDEEVLKLQRSKFRLNIKKNFLTITGIYK